MLKGSTRLKPDSLLGVLVCKEESILCGRAQTLDLSQLLSEGGRTVHHRRLGRRENMIENIIMPPFGQWLTRFTDAVIVKFFGNPLAPTHRSISFDKSNIQMYFR